MVGHRIGAYTVTGTLGRGGYGEVVAAVHDVLGRDVAIKVLHAKWCDDHDAVHRFVAEARAVSSVRHPNIVDVVDFGTLDDGRHYHVMERLHGESLGARLAARGRLPLAEAVPILRLVAAALDAAHAAGIVHRDVKPENVFLHRAGGTEVAKLIDFGLAKLIAPSAQGPTQTGVILGTPAYMAPEQCRGSAVDHRCDVYAFGVIAYELLAGSVPHRGADPVATLLAHVHDAPEPPSRRCAAVPVAVDAIVLPLLAKQPAQRPAPLGPVVDALAAIPADAPGPAPASRRRAWWIAGAAVAAGGAVAAVVAVATDDTPAPARPAAVDVDVAAPVPVAPVPAPAAMLDAAPAAAAVGAGRADATPGRPSARGDAPRRPNPEEPENPYGP